MSRILILFSHLIHSHLYGRTFFQRFFNFLCDLVLSARGRLLWFGFLANLFVFGIWKFSSNLEHSKCSLSTFLALRNFWNSFPFTVGVFAAQVAGEIRNFEKLAKRLKFPNPYKHPLKSRIWEEVILSNELIRDGISVFSSRATFSFCCSYILYCCLSKVPE